MASGRRSSLIRVRYDGRMPFEVSIPILNHIADRHLVLLKQLRALAGLRKTGRVDAQVLALLKGD